MRPTSLALPYAHLNLRWNPFGEPSREDRAELAVVELPDLAPGDALQFLGESGRGKSTHLLALLARHSGAFYEHVPEERDRLSGSPALDGVVLIDEAQRLRPRLRRRLLRSARTIAWSSHGDIAADADPRRVRTIRVGGLTAERLGAIVERRVEWARRGPGPVPVVPLRSLSALVARHGDDVRAIEGELYHRIHSMGTPGDVEV